MFESMSEVVKKQIEEEHSKKNAGRSEKPPKLFNSSYMEKSIDTLTESGSELLENRTGSKVKSAASNIKMLNNFLGVQEYGGLLNGGKQVLKDKFKISSLQNSLTKHQGGLTPSKGAFHLGKNFNRANKALQIASTAEDAYSLGKAVDQGNDGQIVKSSADLISEATLYSKHPAVMAFGVGYEGMKFINEQTDNAVPDAVYDGIFNDFGDLENIRNKNLDVKAKTNRMDLELKSRRDAARKACGHVLAKVITNNQTIIEESKTSGHTTTPQIIHKMPSIKALNNKDIDIAFEIVSLEDLLIELKEYHMQQEYYLNSRG